ncbi:MAG: carboxypeptidase-like regulatory domain-containing protein [Bacteroides sp.]|nr:carboxypeptidase-like regulatory domain-containing protein [Bacteroides sp.]
MKKKQRADARSTMCKVVKLMFALTLLLMSGTQAKATSTILSQTERTISGLVKDDSGEPVIGAAVVVKGTTIGTTTDIDGLFYLEDTRQRRNLAINLYGNENRRTSYR